MKHISDSKAFKAIKQRAEQEVFACSSEDMEEAMRADMEDTCVCEDDETPPWQRCPVHDAVTD